MIYQNTAKPLLLFKYYLNFYVLERKAWILLLFHTTVLHCVFYTCFTYRISPPVSWNSAGAVTAEESSALQARNQASEGEFFPKCLI